MHLSFTDAEYRKMTPTERKAVLKAASVVLASPPNGELHDVDLEIRAFEERLNLPSETMKERVSEGSLKETWEICQWLMLLSRRERIVSRTA